MFKRAAAFLLCMIMVLNLASCGEKNEDEATKIVLDGESGFQLEEETFQPKWNFDNEEGEWTNKKPHINPMGGEEQYSSYSYEPDSYFEIRYIDENYNIIERIIYGDVYQVEIPFQSGFSESENMQFQHDLQEHMEKTGARSYGTYEDKLIFSSFDENGDLWWAYTFPSGSSHKMTIIEEKILSQGKNIEAFLSKEGGSLEFSILLDESSFRELKLEFEDGKFNSNMNISLKGQSGDYIRDYNKTYYFEDSVGHTYSITDLPGENGIMQCSLGWDPSESGSSVRISLNDLLEQRGGLYSENLGAIKVSSSHVSDISVRPSMKDIYISHPDYDQEDMNLDVTPDGDYMMYLPSGYWDVVLSPQDASLISSYSVLSVPVKSGEVTGIEVPYTISSSISMESESIEARGIEMSGFFEGDGAVTYNFTLLDGTTASVEPDIENTKIYEGGRPCVIESIQRVETPPDIYLLLDSSGSMKGELEGVISSSRKFIKGIPTDSRIRIIDFDSAVRLMEGETKESSLSSLDKISVGGDTALYGSVVKAADQLKESPRPVIVLFTDGENDIKGEGVGKEEMIEKLESGNVPVFSIGFGTGHDASVLKEISHSSRGRYFSAKDQDALVKVFEAIGERIGNTYSVRYERPKKSSVGDVPVLTFMIDSSGSMEDVDEGFGQRIHNVKELLKPFIMKLPDEFAVQIIGFESSPFYIQSLTNDKRKLIKGVDNLSVGGPTDIPAAINGGMLSLKNIASTKKMMVFLTDEALDSSDQDFIGFANELKDAGVRVLWVGFGNVEVEEDFAKAAEITDGDYLLTNNPEELKESMENLLEKVVDVPDSGLSQISMEIKKEDETGSIESFGAFELVKLGQMELQSEESMISGIKEVQLGSFSQYDGTTAKFISGRSVPKSETIITSRMKVEKSKANDAMRMDVDEMVFMDRIDGLEAPSGYHYIALKMNLENIMEKQKVRVYPDGSNHPSSFVAGSDSYEEVEMVPDYLIADFKNHFFIDVNGRGNTNASIATYLASKSLCPPGDSSIKIEGGKSHDGVLIFIVPDEPVDTLSLHYYDTSYGNIDMPVVGKMKSQPEKLKKISGDGAAVSLSESFSLQLVGYEDEELLDEYGESLEGLLMRTVSANFNSNMEALLDMNPKERLFLEIESGDGSYVFELHPKTSSLPFGHYSKRMMAPGSRNLVKWMFEIPNELQAYPSKVVIELKDKDVELPVSQGEAQAGQEPFYKGRVDVDADGNYDFGVSIMGLLRNDEYVGIVPQGSAVIDVSIEDYQDGFSTGNLGELFEVVSKEGDKRAYFSYLNKEVLTAIGDDDPVFDGRSRRGVLIYDASGMNTQGWVLKSEFIKALEIEIEEGRLKKFNGISKHYYEADDEFDIRLSDHVGRKVQEYLASKESYGESQEMGIVEIGFEEKISVAAPSVSMYGQSIMDSVDSVDEMKSLLKSLRFLPSQRKLEPFEYLYSPESSISQGFAVENDYAKIASDLLSKLGYTPKKRVVMLTREGKKRLSEFAGTEYKAEKLPAVEYEEDGKRHLIVMPFVEELEDIDGLAYYSQDQYIKDESEKITMSVSIRSKSLIGDRTDQFANFSDALAGETDSKPHDESVDVLYAELDLDSLSMNPVELGFHDDKSGYSTYLYAGGKLTRGSKKLLKREYEPMAIEIQINTHNRELKKHLDIDGFRSLDDYLFTIGINLPDLSEGAVSAIEKEAEKRYASLEKSDDFSSLRWYSRDVIYSFLAKQSAEESKMAEELGLGVGRTDNERIVILTMKASKDEMPFESSIDLMQIKNDIHSGDEESTRSFNIVSGIYSTYLESYVLGEQGYGAIDIMGLAPEEADFILMKPYLEGQDVEAMKERGVSERMIGYFTSSKNYVFIPNMPTLLNGTKRWAWIEIDPESYETIGKIDTLENGALVSNAITGTVKDMGQFFVGGFVGVTSSIWSVSAFSLMEDDYDKILKDAKKFVLGMKDSFGVKAGKFSMSVGGKPQISQDIGVIKVSFDGGVGIGQTVFGFTEGFVAGVEKYFEKAK